MNATQITYHRRGQTGVLSLAGTVDIFEAKRLQETALRALRDEKAQVVRVDLAKTQRLDLSALQVLCALHESLMDTGRTWEVESPSQTVAEYIGRLGIFL